MGRCMHACLSPLVSHSITALNISLSRITCHRRILSLDARRTSERGSDGGGDVRMQRFLEVECGVELDYAEESLGRLDVVR